MDHRVPGTYYPEANGKLNHFHSTLKSFLRTVGLEGKSWKPFTVDILPNHWSDMQQAIFILQDRSKVLMFSKAPHEEELLHSNG